MTSTVLRWPVRMIVALTCACMLTLAAVGTAGAADKYPAPVKKAFVKACVKAATKKGKVTNKQANTYCKSAFSCIESKLTLQQFKNAAAKDSGKSNKKILSCEKQALKKIS